jgi:hypothetical protein
MSMLFAATRGLLPPPWSGRIACASVATGKTSRQYQPGLLAVAMAQKKLHQTPYIYFAVCYLLIQNSD